MKKILILGLLLISNISFAIDCNESDLAYDMGYSETSALSLQIKGLDDKYYHLVVELICKEIDSEIVETAVIISDNGFVKTFAGIFNNNPAEVIDISFSSYFDEMTGEAIPNVSITITDNHQDYENEIQYKLELDWNEKPIGEDSETEPYFYFKASLSSSSYLPNEDRFTVFSKRAIEIDRERSTTTFLGKEIKLQ